MNTQNELNSNANSEVKKATYKYVAQYPSEFGTSFKTNRLLDVEKCTFSLELKEEREFVKVYEVTVRDEKNEVLVKYELIGSKRCSDGSGNYSEKKFEIEDFYIERMQTTFHVSEESAARGDYDEEVENDGYKMTVQNVYDFHYDAYVEDENGNGMYASDVDGINEEGFESTAAVQIKWYRTDDDLERGNCYYSDCYYFRAI